VISIVDNFLDQEEFDKLQTLMMGDSIAWLYLDGIDYKDEPGNVGKFQFYHTFYDNAAARSNFLETLQPIINKIKPFSIWRIKANLLTRTPNIVVNSFHTDMMMLEEKMKQWTTSIFYMNTNNGYTKFEDGSVVESVVNRMISFPANMKHTGTSCTDEKTRVLINFNYFK
jgi:hypothetical protein